MAEFFDHEVPSIGKLRQTTPGWMTAWCCHGACGHRGAFALAVFAILWGPGKSSNELRRRLVCPACGRQGMEIMIPSQTGHPGGGWAAFPAEEMLEIRVAPREQGPRPMLKAMMEKPRLKASKGGGPSPRGCPERAQRGTGL